MYEIIDRAWCCLFIKHIYRIVKDFSLQIEAWLLGELHGQERIDFEQALQSDPQLVRAVEQVQGMQSRLTAMHLRKKVGEVLQHQQVVAPSPNFRWMWLGLAGLTILLVFWIFSGKTPEVTNNSQPLPPSEKPVAAPEKMVPEQPTNLKNPEKVALPAPGRPIVLAREFYKPPTGQFIRDATLEESINTPLQQATEAFAAKNYDQACKLLQDDSQLGADESGRFLRANARFNAGQFKRAAQDFKQLENSFQHK